MSMKLMNKAIKREIGGAIPKLILILLCGRADGDDNCTIPYQDIANECEISINDLRDGRVLYLITIEYGEVK